MSCPPPRTLKGQKRNNYFRNGNCPTLKKNQLLENKRAQIVSKKKHNVGLKLWENMDTRGPKGWNQACTEASKELGYWPVPIKKGTEFYELARQIYDEILEES